MTRVNNARRLALLAPSLAALICMGAVGKTFADGDDGTAVDTVIDSHRERQEELVEANGLIQARADGENRDLTEAEGADVDANIAEFDRLETQINRRLQAAARSAVLAQPKGRKTTATANRANDDDDDSDAPAGSRARTLGRADRIRGDYGFRQPGDFFAAVRNAVVTGNRDERLLAAAATTVATEGVGSDGGFAVPPDFRTTILERITSQDSLLSRTDQQTTSSNSMTLPIDMTTDWQATGGIQAYWESEASAISQSKPDIGETTLRASKLAALVPVTEELLEDSAAMGSYVLRKAPAKMDFKISNAIVWGNGVGMPLGFMNSPALVTVAIESGPQTADTIVAQNIAKMYARMPAADRKNAIWLIHPDAEPQLMTMTIGNVPIYVPPGGLSGQPYATLLGRPIIPHEVCKTVGDLGDIIFVSLEQYLTIKKTAGVKAQSSIHLWFDQDLVAFKFTFRLGGQPWWSAPIDPLNGSSTRSPFVALAAR